MFLRAILCAGIIAVAAAAPAETVPRQLARLDGRTTATRMERVSTETSAPVENAPALPIGMAPGFAATTKEQKAVFAFKHFLIRQAAAGVSPLETYFRVRKQLDATGTFSNEGIDKLHLSSRDLMQAFVDAFAEISKDPGYIKLIRDHVPKSSRDELLRDKMLPDPNDQRFPPTEKKDKQKRPA